MNKHLQSKPPLYLLTIGLVYLTLFSCAEKRQVETVDKHKPNVIFVMADDLGEGMLSQYGQKYFTTPNIDKLAKEGLVFTNSFSSTLCAPSRASFLTGYSDCRKNKFILTTGKGYEASLNGNLTDEQVQATIDSAIGEEPGITYLPQVFKQAGYYTGQIGKLDWGFMTTEKQVKNHGWDYHYGYYDHVQCHGFYPMFLHENGKRLEIPGNSHADAGKTGEWGSDPAQEFDRWNMNGKQVYSPDLFIQKALTFIRNNQAHPFFLYHATQLPHGPSTIPAIHPEVAFNDSLTGIEKVYASMVKRLDDDLGLIMNELKNLGILDNTLIIFSSDNGHELYYSYKDRVEKPYRNMESGQLFDDLDNKYYSQLAGDIFDGNHGMAGLKRSNLNGGVKIPLFVYWPGKIKVGGTSDKLVTNYDFLASMADMLGVTLTENKDGSSYFEQMLSLKSPQTQSHRSIAFASFTGPALITDDGWKIRYYQKNGQFQLFNLNEDDNESHDLASKFPEKKDSLKNILIEKCDGDLMNGLIDYNKSFIQLGR